MTTDTLAHTLSPVYDGVETGMKERQQTEADFGVVYPWVEGRLGQPELLHHDEHNFRTPTGHEQDDHQNQHLDYLLDTMMSVNKMVC